MTAPAPPPQQQAPAIPQPQGPAPQKQQDPTPGPVKPAGNAAKPTSGAQKPAGGPPKDAAAGKEAAKDGAAVPQAGPQPEPISTTGLEDQEKRGALPEAADDRLEERLRKAAYNLSGDLVAGDKLVMMLGGKEKAPMQPLGAQLTEPVRHAFVEPADWPKIRGVLFDQRLVVLRADPHQGKVAAAIRMLQAVPERPIYNLDNDVDLARLTTLLDDANNDNPLPPGAGFLLCEPQRWGEVQGWMLQQLEAVMKRIDARMVLTLGTDAPLADEDIREHVVALGQARPHAEILASHLAWRLEDRELAQRLLAEKSVAELADETFTGVMSLKVAADLAVIISQELSGATVDVDRVRARVAERTIEDFDIWFGGLDEVPDRCMAIALAALNGLPYEIVVRAADALADRLDGPPLVVGGDTVHVVAPWRDPFRRTRRERLRLLRAQVRTTTVRGPFGTGPAEVLEYADTSYPLQILTHVWREFDIQRVLLDWLRDLAVSSNKDVRAWSGTALGVLSCQAFDFVHAEALRPMSIDDDSIQNREVVAYALRVPADDPKLRPLVTAVITGLYTNRDSPFGQATAARAYGISLGRQSAPDALTALDRLATIDHIAIASAIAGSLGDLILQNEQDNAPLVLDRISGWLNDRRRALTGQFAFLQLARSLTTEVTMGDPAVKTSWPTLLMFADQRLPLRHGLIGMWRHVLHSGTFPLATEQALDTWAALAEADGDVQVSFCRMLAAAAEQLRTGNLIRRHVTRWRAVDNLQPKPRTAYAVEAALDARSEPR
ncbi:hypothetical protein [Winogradskya humida]|uniref:HEAT repeat protein n=1 Tax=Winogradskya humida TaxID=113566 RepID=A0ABQ3ZZP8_9ACTN|nr:hypothetical protein [Actinoplanes humidus]GIE23843.1 hypothetical protein Ahu01nite_069450 [Actinoplanes humidus]